MLRKVVQFGLLFSAVLYANQAQAITIGGVEYTEFLSVTTGERLGYWNSMNKYYTYDNVANSPVRTATETYSDPQFAGGNVDQVYAMGTTATPFGAVNNGVVELLNAQGQKLLSATLSGTGTLEAIKANGDAGRLEISGLYTVNSGLYAQAGLLSRLIYIELVFERTVILAHGDFHLECGTFRFYQPAHNTDVPEPASVVLLMSSLLGVGRLRRKQK